MITVIASIKVKKGFKDDFTKVFKQNMPLVLEEKGCIEYYPTIDTDSGLELQRFDNEIVTIIEKWESVEALKNHLQTSHMNRYKEQVKDMVESLEAKVLQEA